MRTLSWSYSCILATIGCVGPSLASPLGPVQFPEQLSILGVRYSAVPERPHFGAPGSLEAGVTIALTNSYIAEDSYLIDEEVRSLYLRGAYSLAPDLTVQLSAPIVWRGGGAFDQFIDDWHRTFSLPRGGRNRAEDDQFFIGGVTQSGDSFELREDGTQFGNVVAGLRYAITEDEEERWSLGFDLSLPTAGRGYGHDGVDGAMRAFYDSRLGELQLTAGAAVLVRGDDTYRGVEYRPLSLNGFGYLEWLISERWSLGFGVHATSEQVENIAGFPGHTLYLDTAVGYRLNNDSALQLALRENPSPQEGSADVTVALEYRVTARPG